MPQPEANNYTVTYTSNDTPPNLFQSEPYDVNTQLGLSALHAAIDGGIESGASEITISKE